MCCELGPEAPFGDGRVRRGHEVAAAPRARRKPARGPLHQAACGHRARRGPHGPEPSPPNMLRLVRVSSVHIPGARPRLVARFLCRSDGGRIRRRAPRSAARKNAKSDASTCVHCKGRIQRHLLTSFDVFLRNEIQTRPASIFTRASKTLLVVCAR
jgi:hypothetical protein